MTVAQAGVGRPFYVSGVPVPFNSPEAPVVLVVPNPRSELTVRVGCLRCCDVGGLYFIYYNVACVLCVYVSACMSVCILTVCVCVLV